jgi:hypothetical protein
MLLIPFLGRRREHCWSCRHYRLIGKNGLDWCNVPLFCSYILIESVDTALRILSPRSRQAPAWFGGGGGGCFLCLDRLWRQGVVVGICCWVVILSRTRQAMPRLGAGCLQRQRNKRSCWLSFVDLLFPTTLQRTSTPSVLVTLLSFFCSSDIFPTAYF